MANKRETTTAIVGRTRGMLRALRRRQSTGFWLNFLPSGFWLFFFFFMPLCVMFYYSFGQRGAFGEVLLASEYIGFHQYTLFFIPENATLFETIWYTFAWIIEMVLPFELSLAADDPTPYVRLTLRSIWYGVLATGISFAIGYPTAYYIGRIAPEEYQNLLLVLVILPFWASYLVRIYAIKLLLAGNSVFTNFLGILPFYEAGASLMHTQGAVMLGLVYIWVPFMILPVYASIEEIDFTLQEAAMDLGADRFDAFRKVIFPLSKPGVMAGSVLVFIPSTGAYVIPELLGGTDGRMIGNFIADQFGAAGNWPLGAAASFVLVAVMLAAIGLYQRYADGDLA